jgi:hypothetical protein
MLTTWTAKNGWKKTIFNTIFQLIHTFIIYKKMKKLLKILTIFIGLIFLGGIISYFIFNEKLPFGTNTKEADELAQKMMKALNKPAWDSSHVLSWTFKGHHSYVWDKKNNLVAVKWDDKEVLLNLRDWPKSKAFENDVEITDRQLDVLRGKAYAYFCNDSFWLIAPLKVFDEGVSRRIVNTEDHKKALLVTYSSGGVTPGDTYLWYLNDQNIPESYKMWVKIIPIGGVKATWENWIRSETGVMIAKDHKLGPLNIDCKNIKMGNSLEVIGLKSDYFKPIL